MAKYSRAVATLLLVRHGETDWNRDHRWQGFTGPSLNDLGRRQARDLAATIDHVDAIYSSDTERAYETALILAERHGLDVQTDDRLREVNFGLWEGLTRSQINERFSGGFARWLSGESSTPNGGESDEAMAARVLAALSDIANRHGDDERVLVVTSGGPIRAAQAHLKGVGQRLSRARVKTVQNCSLVGLVWTVTEWWRHSGLSI
ncbi:MAG: histidine phosphatase family protein [Actinobacteria bacterium]|nr:MAG: histidine phosphatase family protein [Actinomycetota bacterium]